MTNSLNGTKVSVVIPTFNELLTIVNVVRDVQVVIEDLGIEHEIIVVDDGSTDGTSEVLRELGVKVIKHETNLGKGRALRTGFLHAQGDVVVTIDSDGSHDTNELPLVLDEVLNNGIEMCIGSRFKGKILKGAMSPRNVFGNHMINLIMFALFGKYVSDSQSGFRAIKKGSLKKFNLSSEGYEIESELTAEAMKNGIQLKEVPITCMPREYGSSYIRLLRDARIIFGRMVRERIGVN